VAILAGGRLLSTGRLSEILAFDVKGWEVVVDAVPEGAMQDVTQLASRAQKIGGARYALEFAADARPDALVRELASRGASVLSVNPLRETLEDVFMREVAQGGTERSL
jgi:ABC-2 type transport system ATP-binding protein